MKETGHISIHTENILPIIKKWLYSEKEIFLRELVSNACDAIYKLEKLSLMGECAKDIPDAKVTIVCDKDKGTLSITDTGIGLTADEIKKYINQVAFSGVKDFIEKYQGKDDKEQVIGHFGLGFYSTFMVAKKVEIDSLSYQTGAEAIHWSCDGSTEFELSPSQRKDIGTTITLHISDDSKEMLEPGTIRQILQKYCAFIRYPIYLGESQVNDTKPLWTQNPSSLKDEDYKQFFSKLFPFAREPLFWIHLNVDYPFKLRGILFFPQLKHELDASSGEVKLYCNQVYVADNPKELLPDFLTLLKGVIDCPDLPLNVSRSYLQNEPQAIKIRDHIVKKVADRLTGMAKTEKENFEKYWDDIHGFVKYGMMRDQKFFDRLKEHLLFKSSDDKFITLDDYLERMKDKTDGRIIYASDDTLQSSYLSLLSENGIEAVVTNSLIDQHFIPHLEMNSSGKYKFQRIDADVLTHLVDATSESKIIDPKDQKTNKERLETLFQKYLPNKNIAVRIESIKSEKIPAMIIADESMRRIKEMSAANPLYAALAQKDLDAKQTLLVNPNSTAVKNLLALTQKIIIDEDQIQLVVEHIYDLANLQHGKLSRDDMKAFIERSASLLGRFGGSPEPSKSPS
ncbi:MAG: molecular chaperone HtpG [Oligoflexales bacterium]